jgi:DNA repair protein RecO (recombination protein O)
MPLARDRCICLRKVEYSETSQIVALFGREYGIIRLIAKGAHRRTRAGASKFDGGVDLLDLGDAVFSHAPERDLCPLTEWHLVEGHLELRQTLRGMYLGLYAAELVSMLIEEHDPHPNLFDRLEQILKDLATPRREESFLAFELDLLRDTGYLPEISSCVQCGAAIDDRQRVFFTPARGGVVCRNCEMTTPDRIETDPRLLRMTQGLLKLPRSGSSVERLPRLTTHQTHPVNRLLAEHIEHTLSRRLRMPGYILPANGHGPGRRDGPTG